MVCNRNTYNAKRAINRSPSLIFSDIQDTEKEFSSVASVEKAKLNDSTIQLNYATLLYKQCLFQTTYWVYKNDSWSCYFETYNQRAAMSTELIP